jgi:hypothetical protein
VAVSAAPPYDRTAQRPSWPELPASVRACIEDMAGAPVAAAAVAGGGFTRGFAGMLQLADGRCVFVKAAPEAELPVVATSYRREAEVLAVLPDGVPCPRLLWSAEEDGWVVLGTTPVAGRMPGRPWAPADVASAVRACEAAAEALTPAPSALSVTRLADDLGGDEPFLSWFGAIDRGAATSDLLSPWAMRSLPVLQGLVDESGPAIDGETACHGDLRPDNVVLDQAGVSWICDWNWLSLAAPWTDLVGLLITVHADGLDADVVLRSTWLSDGLDDDAVDAWLALIAAFMLSQAGDAPPSFASSWLGAHRAYFGTAALDWIERRRTR